MLDRSRCCNDETMLDLASLHDKAVHIEKFIVDVLF